MARWDDSDEDSSESDALTPDEVLELETKAARYSRVEPLTHYPALATRWAWQRTLIEDAQQSMEHGPVLRMLDVIEAHVDVVHEWPSFCLEIFSMLYGTDSAEGTRYLDTPSELGMSLVMWLQSMPQWQTLRKTCRRKRAIALSSAAAIANGIAHEVLELSALGKKDEDKAKSPEELVDEAQALVENGVSEEKVAALYDPKLKKSLLRRQQLIQHLDQESGFGAAKAEAFAQLLNAILKTAEDLGLLQDMLQQCGLGPSLTKPDDDPVSLELLKTLRALPHLKDLVQLVGRMQRAAHGGMSPSKVRIRPEGIHQSQTDLLLSEYALSDAAPDLWLRRFLDKETLGLERVGEEPLAHGDLVVVVDDSGSMAGERRKWARALAAALVLEAMASDRRALVAIYASVSHGEYADVIALEPKDLPSVFKLLGKVLDGGTETRAALLRAASKLTAPLREPDIILITDGQWEPLHERDWPALKGPDGTGRLYVLLLAPYGVVKDVPGAERTWAIKELDIETTREVLRSVRESPSRASSHESRESRGVP